MDNYDLEDICVEAFGQDPVFKNTEYTNETKREINENEDPMYAMITEAFGDENEEEKDDEDKKNDDSSATPMFGSNDSDDTQDDSDDSDDATERDDSDSDDTENADDNSGSKETATDSDDGDSSNGVADLFGGDGNSDSGSLTKVSDFGVKALLFSTLVHFWHLNCEKSGNHEALADLYDSLEDNGDKILEAVIGQTKNPVSPSELEFEYGDLSFGDEAINKIKDFRDEACELEKTLEGNAGLANIIADVVEDCDSAIYKLTRLN